MKPMIGLVSVSQPRPDETPNGVQDGLPSWVLGAWKTLEIFCADVKHRMGSGNKNSIDQAWSQRWSAPVPPCPDDVLFNLWHTDRRSRG